MSIYLHCIPIVKLLYTIHCNPFRDVLDDDKDSEIDRAGRPNQSRRVPKAASFTSTAIRAVDLASQPPPLPSPACPATPQDPQNAWFHGANELETTRYHVGLEKSQGETQGVGDPPGASRDKSTNLFRFVVFPPPSTHPPISARPPALATASSLPPPPSTSNPAPNRNETQQCCLHARRQRAGRQQNASSSAPAGALGSEDAETEQQHKYVLLLALITHPPPPSNANFTLRRVFRASTPMSEWGVCELYARSSDPLLLLFDCGWYRQAVESPALLPSRAGAGAGARARVRAALGKARRRDQQCCSSGLLHPPFD
ncbi:hypothetical protein GALMADRAFT_139815 [Galerina marginata CBS 339.88]|uniref:Uncharacterized protein n=1 Tax=Galerina marginata (strain CBS 339.88) TaxID=685588 RepID=A0A067T827_GALM3|nr:hypothetical protein GALMADRAFT_139815 [Galerina marginata CBS 339.88]